MTDFGIARRTSYAGLILLNREGNTDANEYNLRQIDSQLEALANAPGGSAGDPIVLAAHTLGDGDTTPDVSAGTRWTADNASPTVITNFDGGTDGQLIFVTLDSNTSVAQNSDIDTAFSGPGLVAYMFDNGVWRFIP